MNEIDKAKLDEIEQKLKETKEAAHQKLKALNKKRLAIVGKEAAKKRKERASALIQIGAMIVGERWQEGLKFLQENTAEAERVHTAFMNLLPPESAPLS